MLKCKSFRVICICLLILFLSGCKKFDEGGTVFRSKYRLFGSNKDGARKSWRLIKFEVNGIDSTYLLPGTSIWPDYYKEFAIFYRSSNDNLWFRTSSYLYEYHTRFDSIKKKKILIFNSGTYYTSYYSQCAPIGNDTLCARNLFFPEYKYGRWEISWEVKKLTQSSLILETTLANRYRIELAH